MKISLFWFVFWRWESLFKVTLCHTFSIWISQQFSQMTNALCISFGCLNFIDFHFFLQSVLQQVVGLCGLLRCTIRYKHMQEQNQNTVMLVLHKVTDIRQMSYKPNNWNYGWMMLSITIFTVEKIYQSNYEHIDNKLPRPLGLNDRISVVKMNILPHLEGKWPRVRNTTIGLPKDKGRTAKYSKRKLSCSSAMSIYLLLISSSM